MRERWNMDGMRVLCRRWIVMSRIFRMILTWISILEVLRITLSLRLVPKSLQPIHHDISSQTRRNQKLTTAIIPMNHSDFGEGLRRQIDKLANERDRKRRNNLVRNQKLFESSKAIQKTSSLGHPRLVDPVRSDRTPVASRVREDQRKNRQRNDAPCWTLLRVDHLKYRS